MNGSAALNRSVAVAPQAPEVEADIRVGRHEWQSRRTAEQRDEPASFVCAQ